VGTGSAQKMRQEKTEHFPPKWAPVRRRKCDRRRRAFSAEVGAGGAARRLHPLEIVVSA
jgi:hypothetical protein